MIDKRISNKIFISLFNYVRKSGSDINNIE